MTSRTSEPSAGRGQMASAFFLWWMREGRFIDPDTDDVPWFDKREALCEYAWNAAMAQSGNYVANDAAEATEVRDEQIIPKSPESALKEAQWVSVPLEPTPAMQQAGVKELRNPYWQGVDYNRTCAIYKAMLAARDKPQPHEEG